MRRSGLRSRSTEPFRRSRGTAGSMQVSPTAWLAAVTVIAACTPGGDETPTMAPPDVVVLASWKQTMTIADFHTANMSQAWSTMKTTTGLLCTSCHTEYGSSDEQYFFDMVVQDREILLRFFAVS